MERTECPCKGELSVAFSDDFHGFSEPFSSILQRFSLYSSSEFQTVHSKRSGRGGSSACLKPAPSSSAGDQSRRKKRELFLRNFKLGILFLLLLLFCLLCLCIWFSLLHCSENEVIHFPRGEFRNESRGQTNSWTNILLPLLRGESPFIPSTGNAIHAERGEGPLGVAGNRW